MRKRSRTIRLLELTGVGTGIVRRLDASDHSTSLLIKGGNTQMLAASASNSLIQTYAVCDEITNLSRLLHFCFFFICVFAALVCNDSLIKQACIRLWRLSPNCSKKLHSFRFFCVRIFVFCVSWNCLNECIISSFAVIIIWSWPISSWWWENSL